ncbi:hypothetical protein [Deinococcus sp. UR1]|uniref:hypothetical protein n=1 Tax=Deinococcus sp. UR1 TaxID=1704277 RepID=UPI000C1840E2|nr:hypothetical protein [Deinococcus sp. UR1]PIG96863.1 hypothetical protein AMD26_015140 [Deinococcus sp. UR1]
MRVRAGTRGAGQLIGLLAHELERANLNAPLRATTHAGIGVHTRTLLRHGLVELDPADRLELSVRLTADGFRAAFNLARPVPADQYGRAVEALRAGAGVLSGEALAKSELVSALELARDVLREASGERA